MKRKAFTLIELLVVIAIIAILAAILFPVFSKAKDAAKKTKSISNMRQIAMASLMYAADYGDTLPMSAYLKPPVPPDARPIIFSVYDAVHPYTKNVKIFVSPSDAESPGQNWKLRLNAINFTIPPEGVEIVSYAPNLGLFGENFCGTPLARFSKVFIQSALPDPVGTIMFFDGYIKKLASPLDLTYNNFMGVARHSEGLVINYADGHAKFYRWNGIPGGGTTDVGANRPGIPYYSWRPTAPTERWAETIIQLEAVTPNTPADPYNDLHGVPGTSVGDSEDFGPC
ncbi:MAG: prepilin-type N-terminal cleavage/methylation domain-containing protein [Armatimonadetes bacterium]|nr:prepilin-type N-terminal cleavage/methylation domain-containing protein [Armatimonadota bacterium]